MKKNDWILILSTAAYSFLFYRQSAGVNFFIFSLLISFLLFIRQKEGFKSKQVLMALAGVMISSVCVFYYGDWLSAFANVVSLMLLTGLTINPRTSVIIGLGFAAYSFGASVVFMILDAMQRTQRKIQSAAESSAIIRLMLYVMPFFVVLLFFFLYKGSNLLFDDLTKNINLDFINAEWFFFTAFGFILIYGFFYRRSIKAIEELDANEPDSITESTLNTKDWFSQNLSIQNEAKSGMILFSMLNGLLIIVNFLDARYLWMDGALPQGMSFSDFVHQGTELLIFSIIIAILIIMFYFRGRLNFFANNKAIRILALAWIIQNAFMIISTAYRNNLYINEYSLTFTRIGVYVWLLLALIGLFTTFLKIIKVKSNWYLFRINGWLFYSVLIMSCMVAWDQVVIDFNIRQASEKNKVLDKHYLLSLSDKALPELLLVPEKTDDLSNAGDNYYRDNQTVQELLSKRLIQFMEYMDNKDWRSFNVSDKKIYNELIALNEKGLISSIKLNWQRNLSLASMKLFTNLREIKVVNSSIADYSELRFFPQLSRLSFEGNKITSIDRFPRMDNLKELDLSGNHLTNIYSLRKIPNLEWLDLSGNPNIKSFAVIIELKKLRYLKIGLITSAGYETLQKTFPELVIIADISK